MRVSTILAIVLALALPAQAQNKLNVITATEDLASIAREWSYNDPQGENGRDGLVDRRGTAADRNVELVIPNPYS